MSISFFVRCDLNGLVEETYWSDPVSIAIPSVTNVRRLFDAEGQDRFLSALSQALDRRENVVCDHVSLAGEARDICFFLVQRDRNLWMLANEGESTRTGMAREECTCLIFRMIDHVVSTFGQHQFQDTRMVYSHFEQIQKLNNELVNTHRELLRANRKLEILNEALNNRLVKDPLTSLVSRYQYRSEIARLIEARPTAFGVFAFIDIDDFKRVNDTYGHATGDIYLMEFSKRLSSINLGYEAIHMRIAGDEFGIYMHGLDEVEESFAERFWAIAERTLSSIPIQTEREALAVSCSAGLAIYNRHTTNVFELIEFADRAMYQAKRNGKHNCMMYSHQEGRR